jgi:hypothetical protein
MHRSRHEGWERDDDPHEGRGRYGAEDRNMDWRERDDDGRMRHSRGRWERGERYGRPDFGEGARRWGGQYGPFGGPEERGGERHQGFRGRGPKNYTRSDERLREDVCDVLEDNAELDASEMEVIVEDGEVTLRGQVDGRWAKRLADDIVCSVRGVKECHNQLRTGGMREMEGRPRREMGATQGGNNGGRRSEQFTPR